MRKFNNKSRISVWVGEVCVDGRKEKEVYPAEKECNFLINNKQFNLFIMNTLDFFANGKQKGAIIFFLYRSYPF